MRERLPAIEEEDPIDGAAGERGGIEERAAAAADGDDSAAPSEARVGRRHRLGCGPCRRCVASWPRTFALLFGVVGPLLLLVAVAVFFGYFLAQMEAPGEIETNNDVLATRMALQFQDDVVAEITRDLPLICGCTFLMAEEQRNLDALYLECLVEEERNRTATMPSTLPSEMPSRLPSSIPSLSPSISIVPSFSTAPSSQPSSSPSSVPSFSTAPSSRPSSSPSTGPSTTTAPSVSLPPSSQPSLAPSSVPSTQPSSSPSSKPTTSSAPSKSLSPSNRPSLMPSTAPSTQPSNAPSSEPSTSSLPSSVPSASLSTEPSSRPKTTVPSMSTQPSSQPSSMPSSAPSESLQPSALDKPSPQPSTTPSGVDPTNWTFAVESSSSVIDYSPDAPSNCAKPANLKSVAIETIVQDIFFRQLRECEGNHSSSAVENVVGSCTNGKDLTALPQNQLINPGEMLVSMNSCGRTALDIVNSYQLSDVVVEDLISAEVSFNWIRCSEKASFENTLVSFINELLNPFANVSHFHPDEQEETVMDAWKESQQDLYCRHLEEALAADMNMIDAKRSAFRKSVAEADGFDHCVVNSWAGGWFWFTIMTTIGYGNTSPATEGGRIMIFTSGFFSILLFAGILAKAGSVVVAIVDDLLDRIRLSWLTLPTIQTVMWGTMYYAWSLMIAAYFIHWNEERLSLQVEYPDAYWFAYLTTTTIGLGDLYLEHGSIVGIDLIIWPLLILFGFVLLSSFLNKLGELLASFVPAEHSTLAETLANRPMFSCCPTWFRRHHSVIAAEGGNTPTVAINAAFALETAAFVHERAPSTPFIEEAEVIGGESSSMPQDPTAWVGEPALDAHGEPLEVEPKPPTENPSTSAGTITAAVTSKSLLVGYIHLIPPADDDEFFDSRES